MGAIGDFVATTAWLWYALLAILLLAATWWAFRHETREQASVKPKEHARYDEKASADDLTKIEGIVPKVAKVLDQAGITTFDELAQAVPSEVKKILKTRVYG